MNVSTVYMTRMAKFFLRGGHEDAETAGNHFRRGVRENLPGGGDDRLDGLSLGQQFFFSAAQAEQEEDCAKDGPSKEDADR